jgi:short subunit dehydrogenase-like uncharacterized protein
MSALLIYGAYEKMGRKILEKALLKGWTVTLGGSHGQELFNLCVEVKLPCRAFPLKDLKEIEHFIQGHSVVINCSSSYIDGFGLLAEACLAHKMHYIDVANDLNAFDDVMALGKRFEQEQLSAVAGMHPDVIGCELLAALLKRRLPDSTSIVLACSQTVGFFQWYADNYLEKGMVLRHGALQDSGKTTTMLVDFSEEKNSPASLVVLDPHASLLAVWQSTRIPHVQIYRKASYVEIRLLQICEMMRWILNIPFFKSWLRKKRHFLERYRDHSAPQTGGYRFWGNVQNSSGQSASMVLTLPSSDVSLSGVMALLEQSQEPGQLKPGFFSPAKALGMEFFLGPQG